MERQNRTPNVKLYLHFLRKVFVGTISVSARLTNRDLFFRHALKDETLKDLMRKNISAFSLPLDRTAPAQTGGFSKKDFVPLADVPDLVWKLRGGRFNRGGEGPNHFADLDEPNSDDHNETLLQLCDDHKYIEPEEWLKYYKAVKADQKGSLPFRIAQIYDTMKTAAKDGDRDRFVCAAGILTHYVFDACMPLHISYMYNGDPNGEKKTIVENHKEKQVPLAHGIHELFDNQLMEKHATALQQKLPTLVREKAQKNLPVAASAIKSSKDAAVAAVALMRDTVNYLDPICIVKYYEQLLKDGDSDPSGQLWTKFGSKYLEAVAEGVVLNARLWEAAWREGKGAKKIKPAGVRREDLSALYLTKTGFLDSVKLENIRSTMQWP